MLRQLRERAIFNNKVLVQLSEFLQKGKVKVKNVDLYSASS